MDPARIVHETTGEPPVSEAYQAQARVLWPDADRGGGSYRLAAVPNARSPRLLVPASSPRAAAAALLRFSSALGPRDVVARTGYAALLRAGLGRRLPAVDLPEGPSSLRTHLAAVLGEPVELSLGLGTARANRKPVLEVFDRRGRRLAFAKVGTTAPTRAHVDAEAAALRRLADVDLPADLLVPRLLAHDTWQDCSVLLMTGLPSAPPRGRDADRVPAHEAEALARAFAEPALPLGATPWWGSVAPPVGGDPATTARQEAGRSALADLDDRLAPLDRGAWHGDWTPWNQSRTRHGLALWDWERFETGVPVGLDRCHYAVNAAVRRDGPRAAVVLSGLRTAGLEPGSPADRRLAGAYLLTVAARYARDAATATGEAAAVVARRTDLVLDALEDLTSAETAGHR